MLVANAVLEEKFHLEDDVRTYLNETFENFEYQGNPIRIRDLLTHTSGMSKFLPESINVLFSDFNEALPFKVYEIQKNYSKNDFFEDLHQLQIDTVPGTAYAYSNADTELMAVVLEAVYKKPFNTILNDYFSTAASMEDTHIILPENKINRLANGYGMTGKKVPHEAVLYGADGGVKTTMPDLVNYMALQLNNGNQVIQASHSILYEDGDRKMGYYMPIRNSSDYGTYYSMHGGAFGSQNWLFILPNYNLGIHVITNQSDLDTADKLMTVVNGLIADLK